MMAVIGIESDRSYTLSGNETVSLSHQHMNTYLIKVTLYSDSCYRDTCTQRKAEAVVGENE